MLADGLSLFAGDTQLLKATHDEARRLLKSPGSAETQSVVSLAKRVFQERIDAVALN
jgi:hypothetical protein